MRKLIGEMNENRFSAMRKLIGELNENLFSANKDNAIVDRQSKEQAVKDMLGVDDIDISKVDDDELTQLINRLGSVTTESFDGDASEIITVMRELKASKADILEALQVHLKLKLNEAKIILRDYLLEETVQ